MIKYKINWNQTRKSIRIEITLRPGEGIKENVEVVYKSEYLFVNLKTAVRPVINGRTYHKLRPKECAWWLEGDMLCLELEKALEGLDWPEVIEKDGVKSNVVDEEQIEKDKRDKEVLEKRKRDEEERKKRGEPTQAEQLAKAMGPDSYPPREKHRPYKDNPEDAFLFECD